MTDHVVRVYAGAATLVAFALAWAGIAARPWAAPPADARVLALAQREQRLQRDMVLVRQIVARRRAAAVDAQSRAAAPVTAPPVRIVTLPPVATSRSS